ncbi:helix-turn-helix domain-containing protein [Virgisporangium aurantiacum]|uniref:Transcriptional regulator n=1 Tax=Virgisporangium aurantiacum TaxID=175570 RepID=A0A8J4E5W2_9ACTN|nr:helix-turn-helix domain-containing protein [Virgisporangium aurantiacum]GIJ62756.1 transcriptional regulator [Virgisporangium aurantiacum]
MLPDAQALAGLAGLLADRTRAAFCLALLDGRAWTAGELARVAGVAAPTASEHINRLHAGGLVTERRQGRHRYVELAGPAVARLVEDLLAATAPAEPPRTLRGVNAAAALARGRTCYDHLAGRLGVAVTDALASRKLLDPTGGLSLTPAGREWLTIELGVAPERLRGSRPLTRECLDWTERRPHLAGLAGALIAETFLRRGWIARVGSGRAVRVTRPGAVALCDLLGVDLPLS